MRKNIFFIDLIFLTIALDQLSKWYVVEKMIKPLGSVEGSLVETVPFFSWLFQAGERLSYQEIFVTPFFNIVMVWNHGVSFGLFNGQSDYGWMILTGLALCLSGFFAVWMWRTKYLTQMAACALIIGGAIGNVWDRLRFEAVIDFLDVHAYGYHWPAFNVADSAVVVGILVLLVHSLFFEKEEAA